MSCLIRLSDLQSGTTWDGMTVVWSKKNELDEWIPVDITGASIVANFSLSNCAKPSFGFNTANSSILIIDAINGQFAFQKTKIVATPGDYEFDIFVTLDGETDGVTSGYWKLTKHQSQCQQ